MTFEYFLAYFLILFIATITPGPSMLLALNHGVNYGLTRTVISCLGNLVGNLIMALLSIVGLGAVLIASGLFFNIIKWTGIIYLLYMGIKLIFAPVNQQSSPGSYTNTPEKKTIRLFLEGFIIAIGNPKGILFFTALFPQFINIKDSSPGIFVIIFATLGIVAFGCYMLYAMFGVKLNKLFQQYTFRKIFNRITGSILIGTGVAIAFSKR